MDTRRQRASGATQTRVQPPAPKLDHAKLRLLAVESETDPRTVQREYITPGAVKGLPGHRIRRVLVAHGLRQEGAA